MIKFIPQKFDINLTKENSIDIFYFQTFKLISGMLTKKVIEEALDLLLSARFSDLHLVLMPESLS